MKISTHSLTRAAIIAAIYAVLTLVLRPFSYGPVQLRVSEAMTLLPCLWPEAIPGLFIGCFLSNIIGDYGLIDAFVGGGATLVAAALTYLLRKIKWLAALPPVLINALAIGVMLHLVAQAPLFATILYVGLGQLAACYALGLPLLSLLQKSSIARKL